LKERKKEKKKKGRDYINHFYNIHNI